MGCVGVKEWGQLTSDDSLASPQNQTFNIINYVGFSREQVLRQAGPPMMPYVWVATRLKCHGSFQTSYKDKSCRNWSLHYREGKWLKMGVLEVLSLFTHGGQGGFPETSAEAHWSPPGSFPWNHDANGIDFGFMRVLAVGGGGTCTPARNHQGLRLGEGRLEDLDHKINNSSPALD